MTGIRKYVWLRCLYWRMTGIGSARMRIRGGRRWWPLSTISFSHSCDHAIWIMWAMQMLLEFNIWHRTRVRCLWQRRLFSAVDGWCTRQCALMRQYLAPAQLNSLYWCICGIFAHRMCICSANFAHLPTTTSNDIDKIKGFAFDRKEQNRNDSHKNRTKLKMSIRWLNAEGNRHENKCVATLTSQIFQPLSLLFFSAHYNWQIIRMHSLLLDAA